jgi:hypothetical protein
LTDVKNLPHVLHAADAFDHRGRVLVVTIDLPMSLEAPNFDAEKLQDLGEKLEQIKKTEAYQKYGFFELRNEAEHC